MGGGKYGVGTRRPASGHANAYARAVVLRSSSRTPARNQSVRKALALLRAAAEHPDGRSVSALARAAGLPRATALRLIQTMEEERVLVRVPEEDRVLLGPELVRLARSVDLQQMLLDTARRPLAELAATTRETVTLTVVRPDDSLDVVHQVDAARLLQPADWVGRVFPLHASSSGKLLLASLPPRRVDELVAAPLEAVTQRTLTDRAALDDELARVRERGYAEIEDELEEGLASVSVAVHVRGRLVAMVNVSGPTLRLPLRVRPAIARQARDTARFLEAALAGPGP